MKFPNTEYVKHFKKKKRDKEDYPSPDECVLEMVNYQLKVLSKLITPHFLKASGK